MLPGLFDVHNGFAWSGFVMGDLTILSGTGENYY